MKSYRLGCSFTLIRRKHNENGNFEFGYKSVYLENGTTSHLSFSLCKWQKQFKTDQIRTGHVIFSVLRKLHPTLTRLPVLPYSLNPFLPYEMNQCKLCDMMNRVNVFENVFLRIVLV